MLAQPGPRARAARLHPAVDPARLARGLLQAARRVRGELRLPGLDQRRDRLGTGALVREVELQGSRLKFKSSTAKQLHAAAGISSQADPNTIAPGRQIPICLPQGLILIANKLRKSVKPHISLKISCWDRIKNTK